ncbi:hypothetical protein RA280_47980, partial [Cupriavidus sp. CV2]|uniref:hypothetical protein n=1 Tax=Cupriavidus ulmosensis TaxID=3065913 RepID=UPI00296B0962
RQNAEKVDAVTPGFRIVKNSDPPALRGKPHRLRGEYFSSLLGDEFGILIPTRSGGNQNKGNQDAGPATRLEELHP